MPGKCQHLQAKCINCGGNHTAMRTGCAFRRSAIAAAHGRGDPSPLRPLRNLRNGKRRRRKNPTNHESGSHGAGQRTSYDVIMLLLQYLRGGGQAVVEEMSVELRAEVVPIQEPCEGEVWHGQPPWLSKYH